jgi:hypothetical protein
MSCNWVQRLWVGAMQDEGKKRNQAQPGRGLRSWLKARTSRERTAIYVGTAIAVILGFREGEPRKAPQQSVQAPLNPSEASKSLVAPCKVGERMTRAVPSMSMLLLVAPKNDAKLVSWKVGADVLPAKVDPSFEVRETCATGA